jgi:hypothetical protein
VLRQELERIISIAEKEWRRWGGSVDKLGGEQKVVGVQQVSPYNEYVAEYWKSLDQSCSLNGNSEIPWSAAFISYCFKSAGAESLFFCSYSNAIIFSFLHLHRSDMTILLDASKYPVQRGDLLWTSRKNNGAPYQLTDFDAVCDFIDLLSKNISEPFPSHSDIVINVADDFVETVSGDVRNTVIRTQLGVDENGMLVDYNRDLLGVLRFRS